MIIPSVPERAWKIASAIFANTLLAIGLLMYVVKFSKSSSGPDWFWFVWFSFVGLIAHATLTEYRWEIRQQSSELIRTGVFLGIIPLGMKRYSISEFSCIKRYVTRASGYDDGSIGIYRPSIVLVTRGGKELQLQQFVDLHSNQHPLSETWANRIAEASGLPVVDVIESWEGFL
jgi:hypothetical protein